MSTSVEHSILDASSIKPMRIYSAKEVAAILGISRVQSIYEIPEEHLPKVRRIGTHYGYLGINILAYMAEVPPVDVAAAVEAFRDDLSRRRPKVQAIRPGERVQIF